MKKFRNFLRQPRAFLGGLVLFFLVPANHCPGIGVIFNPPTQTQPCQFNEEITLDARKCAVVEQHCTVDANWNPGDSLSITRTEIPSSQLSVPREDELFANEIRSGSFLMRRLCQRPKAGSGYTNVRAFYEYVYQRDGGNGSFFVNFTNRPALTVDITLFEYGIVSPFNPGDHQPYYDIISDSQNTSGYFYFASNVGGSFPPFIYTWRANGEIISNSDSASVNLPNRNTEYTLTVRDLEQRQTRAGKVVFVTDYSGAPVPGDPTAGFTISPGPIQTNQTVTFNPSSSQGDITRWEWDFDWHGDIVESFDQTINGANGITTTSWNQAGFKYIRLRVTTAAGNFHEIFQRIGVS